MSNPCKLGMAEVNNGLGGICRACGYSYFEHRVTDPNQTLSKDTLSDEQLREDVKQLRSDNMSFNQILSTASIDTLMALILSYKEQWETSARLDERQVPVSMRLKVDGSEFANGWNKCLLAYDNFNIDRQAELQQLKEASNG